MKLPSITGNGTEAINQIPAEVWVKLAEERESAVTLLNQVRDGVPYYMVIPLVLVLVAAFMGYQTFICLFLGIAAAYILENLLGL